MKALVEKLFNTNLFNSEQSFVSHFLVVICGLIVLTASQCDRRVWNTVYEEGVLVEKFQHLGDTVKDGIYESYLADGTLFERSMYEKGRIHGEKKFYFPNGQVESIETIFENKYQGPFKLFDSTGQLLQECVYVNNKTEGALINYYPNGQVKEKVNFVGGEENGAFIEFFSNGNLKAEGTYKDGDNEHGLLQLYDSTGVLIRKMNCEEGVCRTIWKIEDNE